MNEITQNECAITDDTENKNESGLSTDTIEHKEVWKEITGYEGLYSVSSFGRIKSMSGAPCSGGRERKRKYDKILKIHLGKYANVCLHNHGKKKTWCVHQLVAAEFIKINTCCPTCGNRFEVNHKNGDRNNNKMDNLEYLTHRENMIHYLKSKNGSVVGT